MEVVGWFCFLFSPRFLSPLGSPWLSVPSLPHERNNIVFIVMAFDFFPHPLFWLPPSAWMNLRIVFGASDGGGILPGLSFFGCSMFNICPSGSCYGRRPSRLELLFVSFCYCFDFSVNSTLPTACGSRYLIYSTSQTHGTARA